jgi:hypothetical protein
MNGWPGIVFYGIKAWFSSKNFCLYLSHRMFGHMYIVLNIDEKTNCVVLGEIVRRIF